MLSKFNMVWGRGAPKRSEILTCWGRGAPKHSKASMLGARSAETLKKFSMCGGAERRNAQLSVGRGVKLFPNFVYIILLDVRKGVKLFPDCF